MGRLRDIVFSATAVGAAFVVSPAAAQEAEKPVEETAQNEAPALTIQFPNEVRAIFSRVQEAWHDVRLNQNNSLSGDRAPDIIEDSKALEDFSPEERSIGQGIVESNRPFRNNQTSATNPYTDCDTPPPPAALRYYAGRIGPMPEDPCDYDQYQALLEKHGPD